MNDWVEENEAIHVSSRVIWAIGIEWSGDSGGK